MNGLFIPFVLENASSHSTVKSKSPILFEDTMYSPENLPVPIKSLNPIPALDSYPSPQLT